MQLYSNKHAKKNNNNSLTVDSWKDNSNDPTVIKVL